MARFIVDVREDKPPEGPGCLAMLGWLFVIYVVIRIIAGK